MTRWARARVWPWALAAVCAVAQAQDRPVLTAADAAQHHVADYLAQGPQPWQPPTLHDRATWRADFTVAADGTGTHTTVQAAIDDVPSAGQRRFIRIQPGVYRERVCVQGKAPITLYGNADDPAAVRIVADRYNAGARRAGVDAAHGCQADPAAGTHGTPGSATVVVASDDFIAAHITIANDAMAAVRNGVGYPPGAGESGGAQAVALMTQADRVLLHGVRLVGHQDTFFARRASAGAAARVLVRHSLIAGDVDFIFGNATLVIADSIIQSRAGRRVPGHGGHVLAPSTPAGAGLGFLVIRSRFTAEPGVPPASVSLGRAWDEGVPPGGWQPAASASPSPNGQALVRDSVIGAHIAPWAASTSRRPFSASGPQANRLAEFANVAAPDIGRETLPAQDGWAAAEGGTSGGAAALADDVFEVRNRAELVAALSGRNRPRIVRLIGRIDLSVDDDNQRLGFQNYRDPAFNWPDFEHAYDPATWGKAAPTGPLELARQRSAKAQASRVVVLVPSDTTLVGVGADAAVIHGMLLLQRVDNVIVRNLHFEDAYDHFPLWDPKDNASGEWNSEYDNLSLRGATHVWVDHCTFSDGARPDDAERVALGRRMQHHDGLLDITQQSNFITVSWSHFHHHDKTTLVGSGDGAQADAGKLKVTFHHNWWQQVKERTPRVRFGRVHVHQNLFSGRAEGAYSFGYSLGVGVQSQLFSERNAWEVDVPAGRLTRWWKGTAFFDRGSLLNGEPVDLLGALRAANPGVGIAGDVGWVPAFVGPLDAAADVADKVRLGAGAGRL